MTRKNKIENQPKWTVKTIYSCRTYRSTRIVRIDVGKAALKASTHFLPAFQEAGCEGMCRGTHGEGAAPN